MTRNILKKYSNFLLEMEFFGGEMVETPMHRTSPDEGISFTGQLITEEKNQVCPTCTKAFHHKRMKQHFINNHKQDNYETFKFNIAEMRTYLKQNDLLQQMVRLENWL